MLRTQHYKNVMKSAEISKKRETAKSFSSCFFGDFLFEGERRIGKEV